MKKNNDFVKNQYNNKVLHEITKYFSHFWGFLEAKNLSQKSDEKPDWTTVTKFKLHAVTLLKRFNDKEKLVGIRFATNKGSLTRYLMIDLDRYGDLDPRNNPKNFLKLIESAENAGLAGHILTSSSWTNGTHLWFGLSKGIPVFDASCLLQKIIEGAGFKPKDGHIEAFPNCKSWSKKQVINYKGHKLPLQPESGSFLLDEDLNPISADILDFFQALNWTAKKNEVDEELLDKIQMAKEAIYFERKCRSKNGVSEIAKWKSDLESFQEIGWNDFSQTNNLLCKFATYGVVFRGLEGEALTEYTLKTAKEAPGYIEFCRHQHNIVKRCKERSSNAEKYYWALGSIPKRSKTYKELFLDRKDISQDPPPKSPKATKYRIKETVEHIWKNSSITIPHTIREYRRLLIDTIRKRHGLGASEHTLSKYPELWHPKYLGLQLPTKPETAIQKKAKLVNSPEPQSLVTKDHKPLQNKDVCHKKPKENTTFLDRPVNKDVCNVPYMKVLKSLNGENKDLSSSLIKNEEIRQERKKELSNKSYLQKETEEKKKNSSKEQALKEELKIVKQESKQEIKQISKINPISEKTEEKKKNSSKEQALKEELKTVKQESKSNRKKKSESITLSYGLNPPGASIKNHKENLLISPMKKSGLEENPTWLNQCFKTEIYENYKFVQEEKKKEFKTSEEKLKITRSMKGKRYRLKTFATGSVTFKTQIQIKKKNKLVKETVNKTEVKTIPQNSIVKVLNEYHSSSLSENTNPIIVYIKPLDKKDWQTGLAISINKLEAYLDPER